MVLWSDEREIQLYVEENYEYRTWLMETRDILLFFFLVTLIVNTPRQAPYLFFGAGRTTDFVSWQAGVESGR